LCELSNFVWQCETRNGYHISADSHIVEVTAPPGQIGSVIATALGMVTMPIIRYETGDLAETTPERCVCGRTLPVLTRILGRAVDSVELPDRRKLLWPFFYDLFSRYDELSQWRVVQSDPLHLRVELVVPHDDVALMKHIVLHLRKALPRQMELKVERVAAIPVSPGGKARMVISMIGSGIER
jgi:phenylacetate-CoA ligase